MKLSIVVPVYNEERRVQKAIDTLDDYISRHKLDVEVVFVDDGSTDKTCEVIERGAKVLKYKTLRFEPNRGKGFAVRQGVLASDADAILFMDVDMSTPIDELDRFLSHYDDGADIIIGTRRSGDSHILRPQHWIRRKLGRVFTLLSNLFVVGGISDFTCGFKLFSKKAAKLIFPRQRLDRWCFDTEIMFLARKLGFTVTEVPVTWVNDESTKVRMFKDSIRSFVELIKIRINDYQGKYD